MHSIRGNHSPFQGFARNGLALGPLLLAAGILPTEPSKGGEPISCLAQPPHSRCRTNGTGLLSSPGHSRTRGWRDLRIFLAEGHASDSRRKQNRLIGESMKDTCLSQIYLVPVERLCLPERLTLPEDAGWIYTAPDPAVDAVAEYLGAASDRPVSPRRVFAGRRRMMI